ncbi:MAG TPA: peptide ABC transporter substrate-binding protein [Clostridiales bacterium]|nr:peptide ABC transporter substrate-binding protein [Clostridiales bacterium]
MKRLLVLMLSVLLCMPIIATGCGDKSRDYLVVCAGPNPDTIDPALNSAVDGATMILHAFSGLVGWAQKDDGSLELVPDCAEELPEPTIDEETNKATYVFTLKEGLKWSDGQELKASDFEYAWKRAASVELGADYGYMFEVIDGYYGEDEEGNLEVTGDINVTANDADRTLTVVLTQDVPYFYELCAFPTFMPVREDVIEANPDTWATKPETYIGNGPYKITKWTRNDKIVFEKNDYYHNADKVKIKKIEFALSDDAGAMLANYKNGTFDFIDEVPNNEISSLKTNYPKEFFTEGQLGTYYLNFNINADIFDGLTYEEAVKFRKAISLIIDRNYIVEEIGQAGQQPANSFVPTGLTDADTSKQFVDLNGPNRDGKGYFSVAKEDLEANRAEAVELLKEAGFTYDEEEKKFTDLPEMDYLYNTNTGHQAIGEYLQSALAEYGFVITLKVQEWGVFLNTRKQGNYTFARNGWLGDYNDPITFLDMWTSGSGNNDVQFGKGDHANLAVYKITLKDEEGEDVILTNKTWAESYDVLIQKIKTETDIETRYELMHQAEDLLMETGCIIPIYYYVDIFMIKQHVKGFYTSPLGYKFFMYAEI